MRTLWKSVMQIMIQIVVTFLLSKMECLSALLFASITQYNTFKPGCQRVLFIPVFPFCQ